MNTTSTNTKLQTALQNIADQNPNSIKQAVVLEALYYDSDQDIQCFFTNLLSNGCISGMVGSLIYYHDTQAFYDNHYHEIEEIREDYQDSTGISIEIKGDLKNFLAWFSFEHTAYLIACDLGLY